jgi:hypothetical protein
MKRTFLCLAVTGGVIVASFHHPVLSQTMPETPEGYFAYRGTVYAKAGGTICGFTSPGHLEIYRKAKGGIDLKISAISSYKNAGICPVPRAFFDYKDSGFYSFGDRRFCGFGNPDIQNEYRQSFNAPLVGRIVR